MPSNANDASGRESASPRSRVLAGVADAPSRSTSYGPDSNQLYDVRLPVGDVRGATVVVAHGGFWRGEIDRSHAGRQAQSFADDGFHVAVPEYRRTGLSGGGWLGTFDDVRAGLAAVRADDELPEPVVLVGHSAGGHLVTWLLSQPEAAGVLGAISLAGCVDLELTARLDLDGGAAAELMGGGPDDVPERYAAGDPARLVPAPAPVRLIHGDRDDVVPLEISQRYQRVSAQAGRDVPLTVIRGTEHYGLIDPDSAAFATVLDQLRDLARVAQR